MNIPEPENDPVLPDIASIRGRVEAATPGPWIRHGSDVTGPEGLIFTGRDGTSEVRARADRDAEFVANARQDLAALLEFITANNPSEPAADATADSGEHGHPRHRRPD